MKGGRIWVAWLSALLALSLPVLARAEGACRPESFRMLDDMPTDCASEIADLTGATWYAALTKPRGAALNPEGELRYEREIVEGLRVLTTQVDADVRTGKLEASWAEWFKARLDSVGPEGQNVATLEPATGLEKCPCAFFGGNQGPQMCHVPVGSSTQAAPACPALQVTGTPSALARYYTYLDAATQGVRSLGTQARRAQHIALKSALSKWRNLLVDGYTQFPWELWINAALYKDRPLWRPYTRAELNPKRLQYIVLHPMVAVGFQGFRAGADYSAKGVAVFGAELFGMLGYTRSFGHYFGASALLSVDNVDFSDPRLGMLVHLTRYVHLGYTLSLTEKDATLMMSLDLFGWAQRIAGLTGNELESPQD